MKSVSTYLIAICLFVLCLLEKESKQQALDAKRLKENKTEVKGLKSFPSEPSFAENQKSDFKFVPVKFQLSDLGTTDSTSNLTGTASSL